MEEIVFGKREPYVLTTGGVVWQHLGSTAEPKVLRFPVVKVGSSEEELWCALGEFVHEQRQGSGLRMVPPELRSSWARLRGRGGANVVLGEIDLLEQRGSFQGWVQPLVEMPSLVPLVEEGEGAAARDRWVGEMLGEVVPEDTWRVGVSYCLCGPGRDGGDQDIWLLLAAGDLSGRRGWRCLSGSVSAPAPPAPEPPAAALPPPTPAPPAPEPPAAALPPPTPAPPAPEPPAAALPPLSGFAQVVPSLALPASSSSAHEHLGAADDLVEVDLVQMSVDTLEMPTLRRRMLQRVRRGSTRTFVF